MVKILLEGEYVNLRPLTVKVPVSGCGAMPQTGESL